MGSNEATSQSSGSSSYPTSYNSDKDNISKNSSALTDNHDNNIKGGFVINVSDDEGFVSDEEEFQTTSDKLVLGQTVDQGIGEGNCGEIFVDRDASGGENYKLDVNTNEAVVQSGVIDGVEGEESEEKEREAVGELEESKLVDNSNVELTAHGDSVDDTIQVNLAGTGVVVVRETENIKDGAHKPEVEDIISETAIFEPEESKLVDTKLTDEGDCVVDTIQFDVVEPVVAVVAVVGEKEENLDDGSSDGLEEAACTREVAVNHQRLETSVSNTGQEPERKVDEEIEPKDSVGSFSDNGGSRDQSKRIDGQIVTDSDEEEEGDSDEEGDGREFFDSAALLALLKAATGIDSRNGNISFTSQDESRLFTVPRPTSLGSSLQSLRPTPRSNRSFLFNPSNITGRESEISLNEDEKRKLEKLQELRVKFLRLVHRLGVSLEESVAAQVLYRLALLGGRHGSQSFRLDAAMQSALELEAEEKNDLDSSVNILVLGKSGVGKSATINSIFKEEKAPIGAFESGTASVKEISGLVDGIKVRVIDTPGLKSSVMEQSFNRKVLSSVTKVIKKCPPDVVLYVDRLDSQTRDLNDLPLLKTVSNSLGPVIWQNAVVILTHAASAPPDGPSGTPLSYHTFIAQRSQYVQQCIGHVAASDLRFMRLSPLNSVSLVENHRDCRKNMEAEKILPNGQRWRSHLLLLCFSMKILAEANSISKIQDPFDHRKLFGFRTQSLSLPYMLTSMLQSREHPKLPSNQGGDNVDSDIDLDSDEEDEYDQLPPFRPLRKAHIEKLSKDQRNAYFEEYDYRVKLLQKKQWREHLRRMREIKKKGKNSRNDFSSAEGDSDSGAPDPIAVPLPASFDSDNPAYRYRFLEPTTQFLTGPVHHSHGWDHDCGYDSVNLEHSLAIASRFPLAYTVQITKDKKDFTINLESSVSAKHGSNISSLAGFEIQSTGENQLAYIFRGETKIKNFKNNNAVCGVTLTLLGENVVPGVKIEDQIKLGKQYVLVGSASAIKSQHETAYGANFELQRRELDFPIGQVQSTLSMSVIKWRGDLTLGFNNLAQFSIGRNSKVAVRAGINDKLKGNVTVRTSSSEHLSLALAAVLPAVISIYRKLQYSTY